MFKLVVTALVFIAVGFVLGKFVFSAKVSSVQVVQEKNLQEVREVGYKFISPLLECETGNDYYKLNGLDSLQNKIEDVVSQQKEQGQITDAAVYFRDLNNGPWFGVNEHMAFSPASLLKLPVMMAYYKKAESDPGFLQKKVTYEAKDALLDQNIRPKESIQVGKSYSFEELLEHMMIYSDNAALTLLEDSIDPKLIDKVTLDLGVETANDNTPVDFMSVKGYAGLFRILYNASYLEKDYSEKTLGILSNSEFQQGIVAGVPKDVVVSHKFGERQLEENAFQLHDCGIVYYKKGPYLLCIMSRGQSLKSLENFIAQVSQIIYEGIEKRSVSYKKEAFDSSK